MTRPLPKGRCHTGAHSYTRLPTEQLSPLCHQGCGSCHPPAGGHGAPASHSWVPGASSEQELRLGRTQRGSWASHGHRTKRTEERNGPPGCVPSRPSPPLPLGEATGARYGEDLTRLLGSGLRGVEVPRVRHHSSKRPQLGQRPCPHRLITQLGQTRPQYPGVVASASKMKSSPGEPTRPRGAPAGTCKPHRPRLTPPRLSGKICPGADPRI